MNFNEYQLACLRTANPNLTVKESLLNWALGLAGESGEYIELVKKEFFHKKPYTLEEAKKELGDVLYYLTQCAHSNGLTLNDIAEANVEKLKARYPEGFEDGGGIRGSLPQPPGEIVDLKEDYPVNEGDDDGS